MDEQTMKALAKEFIEAWNTQEVDRVLACYTEDLIYLDPNTRGEVKGAEAMGRYLKKLFANWKMHWSIKEIHVFDSPEGCAVLWRASFRKPDGEKKVEADGMDLVLMEGNRIKRNEVYFDRAALTSLI